MRDGEEVKISKRTGDIIELRDLLDEVGADATRFTYLLQSVDSPQTVDLGVIVAKTMDNPVFYVQMAHARLCSIESVAAERGVVRLARSTRSTSRCSIHERELEVLRLLHAFPDVGRAGGPRAGAAQGRQLGARARRRPCTASTTTARSCVTTSPTTCARAGCGWPRRRGSGCAVGLGLLGVSAPDRCERPSRQPRCPTPPTSATTGGSRSAACDVLDLADEFGTPLFVYDEAHLRARCREAVAALRRRRRLRLEGVPVRGDGAPRRRGGHVDRRRHRRRARTSRWPPGSTRPRSRAARQQQVARRAARWRCAAGVGRIVVDSFDELDRIEALVAEGLPTPR